MAGTVRTYLMNPFTNKPDLITVSLDASTVSLDAVTNTQVLFSDNGVIGADAGLTYNKNTNTIGVSGDAYIAGVVTTDSILSDTSGVLTLGGVGGTNNENLTFDFETTANKVAINSGTAADVIFERTPFLDDDINLYFGVNQYGLLRFYTSHGTFQLGLQEASGATTSKNILAIMSNNHIALANRNPSTATNPTLYMYSDDYTSSTDWIRLYHNQTNGVIECGTGTISLGDENLSTTGNIYVSGDMNVTGSLTAKGSTTQVTFNIDGRQAGDTGFTFTANGDEVGVSGDMFVSGDMHGTGDASFGGNMLVTSLLVAENLSSTDDADIVDNLYVSGDANVTGQTIVTGSVSADSVFGVNITSGADPGHTHTSSSISPPGSTTQILFNDGGSFGADAGLTYDKNANDFNVSGDATITTNLYVSGDANITGDIKAADDLDVTDEFTAGDSTVNSLTSTTTINVSTDCNVTGTIIGSSSVTADALFGVNITSGGDPGHTHSAAGSTVGINASDITDLNAGTDITADLEEETHAGEHANGGGDAVDHDTLTNFVANEHIDHTAVTLTAGTGLSGGGDISANRTFAVDLNELTTETTIAAGDLIAMIDITDNGSGKITFANFESTLNHDSLTGFVANEHVNWVNGSGVSNLFATTGIGAFGSACNSQAQLYIARTPTDISTRYGLHVQYTPTSTGDGAYNSRALSFTVIPTVSVSTTNSASVNVIRGEALGVAGLAGTLANLFGFNFVVGANTGMTGTINTVNALKITPYHRAGTIDLFRGLWLVTPQTGGTLTAAYDMVSDTGWDWWFASDSQKIRMGATEGDFDLYSDGTDGVIDATTDINLNPGAGRSVTITNGLVIPSGTTPLPAVEGALFLDTDASANGTLVCYSNGVWRTVASW